MQTQKQWQQGDVVFIKVDEIPAAAKKEEKFNGVVQHGEHTGHAHRLAMPVREAFQAGKQEQLEAIGFEMFQHFEEGRRFLSVTKPTALSHEEHKTFELPPGNYEVRIVRELDWFSDMERAVVD